MFFPDFHENPGGKHLNENNRRKLSTIVTFNSSFGRLNHFGTFMKMIYMVVAYVLKTSQRVCPCS